MILHQNGSAKYCVIHGTNGDPVLNTAVGEFCRQVRLCTRADLKVFTFKPLQRFDGYLLICPDEKIAKQFGIIIPKAEFKEETFYIKIEDNVAVIDGGRSGKLYGVYEFLERYFGVRYYTYKETKSPRLKDVSAEKTEILFTPKIRCRDIYAHDSRFDERIRSRLRTNSETDPLSMENYGVSTFWAMPSAHTVEHFLLPHNDPEYGYDKHPEFFSYLPERGKRIFRLHNDFGFSYGEGEICWSNPQVRDILTERVKNWILDSPNAKFFPIDQNDYACYCQCEECTALANKHGYNGEPRWAAPIVVAVNEIAKRIKEWQSSDDRVRDREITIVTFSYIYGKEAPTRIKLEDNMMIRICINPCWAHDINDDNCPFNLDFKQRFFAWQQLSKRLYVWAYPGNFFWYLAYAPSLKTMQQNIKFFVDQEINGLFLEFFDEPGYLGPFYEVRQYLFARCMYNPDFDFKAEYKLIMEYFYGDSAPYLMEFEKRYHENVDSLDWHYSYISTTIYKYNFPDEFLEVAESLFNMALAKANNAKVRHAVRREYAFFKFTKMYVTTRGKDYGAMQEILDELKDLGIDNFKMMDNFKSYYYGGEKSDWFRPEIEERNFLRQKKDIEDINAKLKKNQNG